MKIAFGTVVYEQAWSWWKEFVDSLNMQTAHEFDVLIINDGVCEDKISMLKNNIKQNTYIYDVVEGSSISEIRIQMLQIAKHMEYDLLIIGDFDDTFSKNRIENIVKKYSKEIAFYYHNLLYENLEEEVFTELPRSVDDIVQILESNFLGLSNTAVNLTLITNEFLNSLENVKTNIFDWYLYSKILISGGKGCLVEKTHTIYRQQQNNLAGIQTSSIEQIRKEIMIKKEHYYMLREDLAIAEMLLQRFKEFEMYGDEKLAPYVNNDTKRYWWSNLKVLV